MNIFAAVTLALGMGNAPVGQVVSIPLSVWTDPPQMCDGIMTAVEYDGTDLQFEGVTTSLPVYSVDVNADPPLDAMCSQDGNRIVIAYLVPLEPSRGEFARIHFRVLASGSSPLLWSCIEPVGLCPWFVHLWNPSADWCRGDPVTTEDGCVNCGVTGAEPATWGAVKYLWK